LQAISSAETKKFRRSNLKRKAGRRLEGSLDPPSFSASARPAFYTAVLADFIRLWQEKKSVVEEYKLGKLP
jgi:hypothetical protein